MRRTFQFAMLIAASCAALMAVSCRSDGHRASSLFVSSSTTLTDPDPMRFDTLLGDSRVSLHELSFTNGGMRVWVTNYGGRIVSWHAPGRDGEMADIVLGYDSIEGFLGSNEVYFGALIGRFGNRIAGGRFELDGTEHQLAANNGPNHLHGGPGGFHNRVWEVAAEGPDHLHLRLVSEDGDEGYPGRLEAEVRYAMISASELRIDYRAVTDAPTVVNLTTHPFFNLAGAGSGPILDHELEITADRFTPVDATLIPTGELRLVEGTPFDFRSAMAIGARIGEQDDQLANGLGYDHNFVLTGSGGGALALAARVREPGSGRVLEVHTTEPGLQFYSGNFLDGSDTGREGVPYAWRSAFCLEPQHFPDSPNQPSFPSTVLLPGELYESVTVFRLGVE